MVILASVGCNNSDRTSVSALSDTTSSFELQEGFKIELIASEPHVSDPVDMEIDEYGRLYVVEMHGYPLDISPSGKIQLLSDSNGDGRMDKSTIFADSLVLPTGVMRWKKGILVTVPHYLLYFEDMNDDGRADLRDTVLAGFALSNPQHNTNNPVYGLDNWIYLAHTEPITTKFFPDKFGDKGSDIFYPDKPNGSRLPQNGNNRNVRLRPDKGELEMLSSSSQYGQTFDAWNNHFFNNYDNHIYQEAIASRYLNRNPALLISKATQSLSDHGDIGEIFPVMKDPETQELRRDVASFSSVCGITAYQGGLFPAEFNNVMFIAESVHNLVHADHLKEDGVSFVASRLRARKEFLTSTDPWFRPVNMYIGPDGALYVLDYYREIIEHPEWLWPSVEELRHSEKVFYNGIDKGRIYRITPTEAGPATWTKGLQLGKATNEELVDKLSDPNMWWRMNAQRLLIDRGTEQIIPALVRMAQNTTAPLGRLHALWTLEGLGFLKPDMIMQALKDQVPGIRENAIRLAELHLKEAPSLVNALIEMRSDDNLKVRYQLLCALGFIETPRVDQVRKELLFQEIDNEWMQIAALSAPASQNVALLDTLMHAFNPTYASLVRRLSAIIGVSQEPRKIHTLLQKAISPISGNNNAWQVSVLDGLAQGLENRVSLPALLEEDQKGLVKAFFDHPSDSIRQTSLKILTVSRLPNRLQTPGNMQRAGQMAADPQLSPERRGEALQFLALGSPSTYEPLLKQLILPSEPPEVQIAALQTFGLISGKSVGEYVLQQWPVFTPDVRTAALQTFMKGSFSPDGTSIESTLNLDRIKLLLNAIESGRIQRSALDGQTRFRLLSLPTESLRNQAVRLLRTADDDGEAANKDYVQKVKEKSPNAEEGRSVFVKNCMMCHQLGNEGGVSFGPDLATVRSWKETTLIGNIVNPGMAIANGFDLWTAELKTGELQQGVIVGETSNAVTLRNQLGKETTIARNRIKSLKALQVSAMPTDFKEKISAQQMADLVAFIKKVNKT